MEGETACRPIYLDYYCNEDAKYVFQPGLSYPGDETIDQKPWNAFDNIQFFVLSVFAIQLTTFILMALVHHFKAGPSTKGLNKVKAMKQARKRAEAKNSIQDGTNHFSN